MTKNLPYGKHFPDVALPKAQTAADGNDALRPHIASRMNPPAETLAQAGRDSRRAEHCYLPSEEEISALAASLDGDRGPAILALTVKMAHDFGTLDDEEIEMHARKIKAYGDDRYREGNQDRYHE